VSVRLAEVGEGDLVQWQETVETQIEFVIDTSGKPASGFTIRFTVRTISYVGLFALKHDTLYVLP
jgi:hypothetical protein